MPVLVGWPYKFLTRQCLGQNVRIFGLLESSLGFLIGIPEPDIAHAHLVDMNVCFFQYIPIRTWNMVYGCLWMIYEHMNLAPPSPPSVLLLQFLLPFLSPATFAQKIPEESKGSTQEGAWVCFLEIFKIYVCLNFICFQIEYFSRKIHYESWSFMIFHIFCHLSSSFIIFHHHSSSFIIIHHHLSPSHTYTTMSPSASLLLSSNTFAQAWSPYPFIPERRWGYS